MSSGIDNQSELLGSRLEAARELAFVGREEEVAVFRAALFGGGASVLYVHGPGGIGKSALLRRLGHEAVVAGRPVSVVDGRTLEPSPAAFGAEAGPALEEAGAVLLVDNFERVQGLEGWLRERFLPRVPVGALVVIAGQYPPDMRWQADPGWAGALEVLALRDLPAADAQALLDSCGVPAEMREPLLAFAGGHPLALLLGAAVAVKDGRACRRWVPDQDVVATLLDQLVGELPSAAHQHALEICAHAHMTTEALLRAALPQEAARLFRWLRRLPFVESSSLGLFPHDVVRELLEADLRWRDPEGYAVMHDRIYAYLAEKVRTAGEADVLGAVAALLYLHRDNGALTDFDRCRDEGEFQEELFRPEDVGALVRVPRRPRARPPRTAPPSGPDGSRRRSGCTGGPRPASSWASRPGYAWRSWTSRRWRPIPWWPRRGRTRGPPRRCAPASTWRSAASGCCRSIAAIRRCWI